MSILALGYISNADVFLSLSLESKLHFLLPKAISILHSLNECHFHRTEEEKKKMPILPPPPNIIHISTSELPVKFLMYGVLNGCHLSAMDTFSSNFGEMHKMSSH